MHIFRALVITNEVRKSVIDTYFKGFSKKDIANILNINITLVYAIIKVYVTENRVCKKLKGGARKRVLIDVHCTYSSDTKLYRFGLFHYFGVNETKLMNDFNIDVSTMTICRCIKTIP